MQITVACESSPMEAFDGNRERPLFHEACIAVSLNSSLGRDSSILRFGLFSRHLTEYTH